MVNTKVEGLMVLCDSKVRVKTLVVKFKLESACTRPERCEMWEDKGMRAKIEPSDCRFEGPEEGNRWCFIFIFSIFSTSCPNNHRTLFRSSAPASRRPPSSAVVPRAGTCCPPTLHAALS